jgi:stage II sporulation protein D (peptidoglycan lytic transglycosylase)
MPPSAHHLGVRSRPRGRGRKPCCLLAGLAALATACGDAASDAPARKAAPTAAEPLHAEPLKKGSRRPIPREVPEEVRISILSKKRLTTLDVAGGRCRAARPKQRGSVEAKKIFVEEDDRVKVCGRRNRCIAGEHLIVVCRDPAIFPASGGQFKYRKYGNHFDVTAEDGALRIVASVPLEKYVAGVVAAELHDGAFEAKKALAVVVRTFATTAAAEKRHKDAALCDLTHCQLFRGVPRRAGEKTDAAKATEGEVLVKSDNVPSHVFFHSTCGGHTMSGDDAWPDLGEPQLVGVTDVDREGTPWCKKSPYFEWTFEASDRPLAKVLAPVARRKLDPQTLALSRLDDDGTRWRIEDKNGAREATGTTLHVALSRAFGFGRVKSNRFSAERVGAKFHFSGHGMGHGVGLCQLGADARARAGEREEQILKAYFPELHVARLARAGDAIAERSPRSNEDPRPSSRLIPLDSPAGGRVSLARETASVLAGSRELPGPP